MFFKAPVFQPQKKTIQVPEAFCDNNRRGGTMEQEDDIEVELHFSCGLLVEVALTLLKRWAPTSYKWRYNNPYKWPSKRRTGIIIILIGSYYRSLNSIYTWWRGPLEVPLWYNMAMKHGSGKCWGHLTLTPASFFLWRIRIPAKIHGNSRFFLNMNSGKNLQTTSKPNGCCGAQLVIGNLSVSCRCFRHPKSECTLD